MYLQQNNQNATASQEELRYLGDKYPYQQLIISLADQVVRFLPEGTFKTWFTLFSHKNYHTGLTAYDSEDIARRTGQSRRTIQRHVNELLGHQLLEPTKYYDNLSNSYAEFQMTYPREFCNNVYEGNERREGPANYENPTREYSRDENGGIKRTSYTNGNGVKVIILGENESLSEANKTLDESFAANNQPVEPIVEDAPPIIEKTETISPKPVELTPEKKLQIELEIEAMNAKIDSDDIGLMPRVHLMGDRARLAEKLKMPETDDTHGAILITRSVIKKQRENTTISNYVNPKTTRKNKDSRYLANAKNTKQQKPIRYRDNPVLDIPQKEVCRINAALKANRAHISDPPGLFNEMLWAIARCFAGKPGNIKNPTYGDVMRFNTSVAIKLIGKGTWTTPAGFMPQAMIDSEKKIEWDRENKLTKRTKHKGYIPSPLDMTSLKEILGIQGLKVSIK